MSVEDAHDGISIFLDVGVFLWVDRMQKGVWVQQCRGLYLTCELVVEEGRIPMMISSLPHKQSYEGNVMLRDAIQESKLKWPEEEKPGYKRLVHSWIAPGTCRHQARRLELSTASFQAPEFEF